jgi:hypothetical protein
MLARTNSSQSWRCTGPRNPSRTLSATNLASGTYGAIVATHFPLDAISLSRLTRVLFLLCTEGCSMRRGPGWVDVCDSAWERRMFARGARPRGGGHA